VVASPLPHSHGAAACSHPASVGEGVRGVPVPVEWNVNSQRVANRLLRVPLEPIAERFNHDVLNRPGMVAVLFALKAHPLELLPE